ncbi:hypothetical protein CA984_10345 [Streptosporangium minutum]|uniref:Uncharacterized protein n=1 Tax=Streptosporangium minutum TaxID=569862 RepID=A0A243RRH8_9ACTN|nr:hypothetical protein CA984_10345 [Streptosporangium minutum]
MTLALPAGAPRPTSPSLPPTRQRSRTIGGIPRATLSPEPRRRAVRCHSGDRRAVGLHESPRRR